LRRDQLWIGPPSIGGVMARESGFDRHNSQVPDINRGLIPAGPLSGITSISEKMKKTETRVLLYC